MIMPSKSSTMSFSDLMSKSSVMSTNIKLNAEKIGRFGIDVIPFTNQMDNDKTLAEQLDQEQERLKSELKIKTAQVEEVSLRMEQNLALARKTVKLAEPQLNWVAYGIADKK